MGRIIEQQRNLWGTQELAVEPQRADLWVIDFRQAVTGINATINENNYDLDLLPATLEAFYATSVTLPPLGVRPVEVPRDSRPYKMPGEDECLGEIKVTFVYDSDSTASATTSKVYKFLDTWRALVRAGRGALGHETSVEQLNKHYRVDYAFDINLTLLRGSSSPTINSPNPSSPIPNPSFNPNDGVANDLEQTAIYSLENAWLAAFRISDLDYSRGNEIVKVEAIFYAENILNEPVVV